MQNIIRSLLFSFLPFSVLFFGFIALAYSNKIWQCAFIVAILCSMVNFYSLFFYIKRLNFKIVALASVALLYVILSNKKIVSIHSFSVISFTIAILTSLIIAKSLFLKGYSYQLTNVVAVIIASVIDLILMNVFSLQNMLLNNDLFIIQVAGKEIILRSIYSMIISYIIHSAAINRVVIGRYKTVR